jgi:hypothetical protein
MNYNVGWIDAGDWMGYTINDVQEGMYNIELSVSSSGGSGVLNVLLNGESVGYKTVENTGGWYNWQVITIPNIQIESAPQHLKVMTLQPGYNIESIQFVRIVGGCTDNTACNYDPNAESDDGTCAYTVDCAGVCDGSSLEDACGVCDDDATNDDFTCTGCLDETACNFDEEVIIEGVCEYAAEGFDCSGNALSIERWIPAEYDLAQNYPNPFNPSTVISFSLPEYTKVSLLVYDVHGRVVSTLVSDALSPGVYHYSWNGKSDDGQNLPSGIFFYALETTGHHYNYLQKRKMLFIK